MPSDTDFESDYVTGLEDLPCEKVKVKKPHLRRKLFKGLNNACQTSSFIQNILSEDSKTGVAVVDLFVAVKKVKDSLDFLVRKNDDVLHQINALNVESEVMREEYRNLAEDVQSFLKELESETIHSRLMRSHECNVEKNGDTSNSFANSEIEDLCEAPSSLKNVVASAETKRSTKDRPRISKTLLGSFLASVLWLKKREPSLAKSGNEEKEAQRSDSAVQMICNIFEMLGGFADSVSEDEEYWSETEDQSSHWSRTASGKAGTSAESNESDSAFEEAFATPPPSPQPIKAEPRPKSSVTCMGDLTKEKKKNVSTGTDGAMASIAAMVTDEIKSTIRYLKSKTKAITTDRENRMPDKDLKKLSELTIEGLPTADMLDGPVTTAEERRSYSSDSFDDLIDFDSDDLGTSSLSGDDEMEEFEQTKLTTSNSSSKAILPRSRARDVQVRETYKTATPAFYEVWNRCPTLFVQEMVYRTAKVKQGRSWEIKEYESAAAEEVVALTPGEKREKEVVIENSNLDLVIYIQVEVENDDKGEQLMIGYTTNSLGTQTPNLDHKFRSLEETQRRESFYDVLTDGTEKVEESVSLAFDETAKKEEVEESIADGDAVSEISLKKNIPGRLKTENAVAVVMSMKQGVLTSSTYVEQTEMSSMCVIERPQPLYRLVRNVELERALELIHEIENDVVDTKLSDAISILPRLESELRKHFKQKVRSLGDSELDKSLDTFFSAFDIWPAEARNEEESENSEERLYNLFTLLGDLEKAVKADEYSAEVELCGYNSSKIYGLLHALTESIRELEECSNVTSLSQTLDIASQVDTAIREYETIVRRTPTDYVAPTPRKNKKRLKTHSSGEMSPKEHLRNVRKKVFEIVEEEAVDTEARLEKDSDLLERLERENDEAMKFVEAFLQKTQRRTSELAGLKQDLEELSAALGDMYKELVKAKAKPPTTKASPKEESDGGNELANLSRDESPGEVAEPVKETVSGLLLALDKLKSRARQKNELCREILRDAKAEEVEKEMKERDALPRSSRSSFTAKNVEEMHSRVKEFKKIGEHSLYLSWTKPEGPLADSVVGYEIFVNGKLNQKVRNPRRFQAVLYSVDLSRRAEVLLYGLLDNGFKTFLSAVTYATS